MLSSTSDQDVSRPLFVLVEVDALDMFPLVTRSGLNA